MLPRLLAAYRKYGSLADGCPVAANHFCNSGALVDTTRNGNPTEITSRPSTAGMGLTSAGGAQASDTAIGNTSSGSNNRTKCSSACRRTPNQAVVAWA